MATGGKFASSQIQEASDMIYDFTCMPCLDDGKNTEAVFQCVECQTYYCQRCVDSHNKFVKKHTILDEAAMKSGQGQTPATASAKLPTDTCSDHHGEVIKMYCGQHDIVCCSICVAVNHRPCNGVEYIPNIASKLLKSTDSGKTKTNLENIRTELQSLKSERLKYLQEMKKQENDTIEDIQNNKKRMQSRLEELAKSSLTEVKTKFKEIEDNVNGDIENVDQMLKDVEQHLKRNATYTKDNESQLFLNIKLMEMQSSKGGKCVKEVRKTPVETVEYRTKNGLQDVKSLGNLKVSKRMLSPLVNVLDLTGDTALSFVASCLQNDLAVNGITSYLIQSTELDADLYTVVICNLEDAVKSVREIKEKLRSKIILVPLHMKLGSFFSALNYGQAIHLHKAVLQSESNTLARIEYIPIEMKERSFGHDGEERRARVINIVKEFIFQ